MSKAMPAGVDRIRVASTAIGDYPLSCTAGRDRDPAGHHPEGLGASPRASAADSSGAARGAAAVERLRRPRVPPEVGDRGQTAAGRRRRDRVRMPDTRAQTSSQHSDAATLLAVMNEPTKLRDADAAKKSAEGA